MAKEKSALYKVVHLPASKYVVTGVTAWLLDNGLFSLLKLIFGNHVLFTFSANSSTLVFTTLMLFTGIGMFSGFMCSFLLNRVWTFKSDGVIGVQLIKCVALLIFNTAVTALLVHLSSFSDIDFLPDLVKYGMSCVTGIWNYFFYKWWVYK